MAPAPPVYPPGNGWLTFAGFLFGLSAWVCGLGSIATALNALTEKGGGEAKFMLAGYLLAGCAASCFFAGAARWMRENSR